MITIDVDGDNRSRETFSDCSTILQDTTGTEKPKNKPAKPLSNKAKRRKRKALEKAKRQARISPQHLQNYLNELGALVDCGDYVGIDFSRIPSDLGAELLAQLTGGAA